MQKIFQTQIHCTLLLLIFSGIAGAQVPQLINYQGILTDPFTGAPVPDDTYSIVFSIYDEPTAESATWTEIQDVNTEKGLFSVLLGSMTPITVAILNGPEKYLGIKVESDPEMTPRNLFTSVAYAIISGTAESLGGIVAGSFPTKAELSTSDSTLPNVGSNLISWNNLKDVPDDFADGVDAGGTFSTLDQAYDQGGAGAGRTIIADAGAVKISGTDGLTVGGNVGIGIENSSFALSLGNTLGNTKLALYDAGPDNSYGLGVVAGALRFHVNGNGARFAFFNGDENDADEIVTFNGNGRVGIGTRYPAADIHVDGDDGVLFTGTAGAGSIPVEGAGTRMMWYPKKGAFRAGNVPPFDPTLWNDANIGFWSVATGYATKAAGAHSFAAGVQAQANHSGTFVWNDNAVTGGDIFASTADHQFLIRARGGVGIGTNSPDAELDVVGTTRTSVLEITGGSDLAELFDISGSENIKPGMIVVIDPEHPGQLRIADTAYDRTVAGCISGANGINPGLTMQQEGTEADGSQPVALSGRVYCWVDAAFGSIQPGDLLTTSVTSGHAMKVTDYTRAQGAILGKAMTSLEQGKGLVLVLITLQ